MKIALNGKMGTGKSWLGDKLVSEQDFQLLSFSFRVKELAIELFDMKEKDRTLLIDIGEKLKSIDPLVWVKRTLKEADKKKNIIIDDLRFTSEYEQLKKNNWIIIKIEIPEEKRVSQLKNKYGSDFESHLKHFESHTENDVHNYDDSKFDFIIRNSDNIYKDLLTVLEII